MPKLDKEKIIRGFSRAVSTYDSVAAIQRRNARQLATIIRSHRSHIPDLTPFLEIGAGTGFLTDHLLQLGMTHGWVTDIAPTMVEVLRHTYKEFPDLTIESLDGEHLALGTRFNAIFSASTFQWFSSLDTAFCSYWRHLNPRGTLAFCMFVDGTIRELHHAAAAVGCRYPGHRLATENEVLTSLIESGFVIEYFSTIETSVCYPSARDFFDTLKKLGSTNAAGTLLEAAEMRRLIRWYDAFYRTDDGVTATFRTLYIVAHKNNKTPKGGTHDNQVS